MEMKNGVSDFENKSMREGEGSVSVSVTMRSNGNGESPPFSGLVICVSGLSKEGRKQVKQLTERLGGIYSPNLHPLCSHLVVQSLRGRKLEHAFTHCSVVTLGWLIDCFNTNVKLSEAPYTISIHEETKAPINMIQSHLSGHSIYIDFAVSPQLHAKVVDVAAREGAVLVCEWFVGCGATYIVCEGSSIHRYLGHCDNIVSPIWVLKTSEERSRQRFIGLSVDLARQVGVMLENLQHLMAGKEIWKDKCHEDGVSCEKSRASQKQRMQAVNLAKCGVRNRRARRLQSCEVPLRPLNPISLLESICWSISEPTSRAAFYSDSIISRDEFHKYDLSVGVDHVESEAPFSNSSRLLTESEKKEVVFKSHFLTILYPVDRFGELGPSSRTYFSSTGFTRLQLLEFIYAFYQENMSDCEIEVAIHTDSRHAEELRSVYCSERIDIIHKRIQFMGSRKSFEMLKRIAGDNNTNVYELLLTQ